MDRVRLIRTKNTLLAAVGAVLLTLELLFAYKMDGLTISISDLTIYLSCFWLINICIIAMMVTGFSERFNDPSLSIIQMYWATGASLYCILLMPKYGYLIYLLVYVIAIFGVFRLRPREFDLYALLQSIGLAVIFYLQVVISITTHSVYELLMIWFVYVCCMSILIYLCRSVALLRRKLKARNVQLQDALTARSQFLANMSHEIRTPMNGVLGMLELIEKNHLDTKQKRYLEVAKSSGNSLLVLINDVLDYSKIEVEKLEIQAHSTPIKKVLTEFLQPFFYMAEEKGLDFIIDIDPSLPDLVRADEIRIRQLVNNIIGNALKFTDKGQILVYVEGKPFKELDKDKLEIAFYVRDTGCGIKSESLQKVFESFSQADNTTTRVYGGSGLGLAISKKLCQLMGGDIEVRSDEGEGSEFCFSVVVDVDDDSASRPGDMYGRTVLIVDTIKERSTFLERNICFLGARTHCLTGEHLSVNDILEAVASSKCTDIILHLSVDQISFQNLLDRLRGLAGLSHAKIIMYATDSKAIKTEQAIHLSEPTRLDVLYSVLNEAGEPEPEDEQSEASLEQNSSPEKLEEFPYVLLVEDNETNQEVAIMLLEDCSLQVIAVGDGQQAIEALADESFTFKIVFMDCQMPVMDGYSATKAIRAGEAGASYTSIPIVAMTANALVGDREKCIAAGMDDYITKPINFEEVEQCVDKWLKRD